MEKTHLTSKEIYCIYQEMISSNFRDQYEYLFTHSRLHKENIDELTSIVDRHFEDENIGHVVNTLSEFVKYDNILNSSNIIAIYSLLEFWISKIAKRVELNKKSKIKLTDLRESSDLQRAKKFLDVIGNVDFDKNNAKWEKILEYRIIRNKIVHNGHNLFEHQIIKTDQKEYTKQERNIIQIINNNKHLRIDMRTGFIFIEDKHYCFDFSTLCEEFLFNILEQLKYSS